MTSAAPKAPANPAREPGAEARTPPQPFGPEFFRARLQQEEEAQPEPEQDDLGPVSREEGDGQPAAADPEGSEDPKAALEEPEEGEEEPDEDTEEPEGEDEEQGTGQIEVDGEVVSLDDVREWKLGYMRQADYTRKTQELAHQRRTNAEWAEALGEYEKIHEGVARDMLSGFEQVDWQGLKAQSPEKYQQLLRAFQTRRDEAQGVINRVRYYAKKIAEGRDQARKEQIAEAREKLPMVVQGWNMDVYQSVRDFAVQERGYSEEEVAEITDWRRLADLHDAMRLHQARTKVGQPRNPNPKPKPKPRPADPKRAPREDGRLRAAQARLAKTPNRKARTDFFAEKLALEAKRKRSGGGL